MLLLKRPQEVDDLGGFTPRGAHTSLRAADQGMGPNLIEGTVSVSAQLAEAAI